MITSLNMAGVSTVAFIPAGVFIMVFRIMMLSAITGAFGTLAITDWLKKGEKG
jgi:hypothetical protein